MTNRSRGPTWSFDETTLALALYKSTGYSQDDQDPKVMTLARLIGRTPGAVVLKLKNLRAVETQGKAGMSHFAPTDKKVWNTFIGNESILIQKAEDIRKNLYSSFQEREEGQVADDEGRIIRGEKLETERFAPTRIRQQIEALRRVVLRIYSQRCSFCDVDLPELLEVSHISRWSEDEQNRLNPANALCLCLLHHRAFDKGMLTLTSDSTVRVSSLLASSNSKVVASELRGLDGKRASAPSKFPPDPILLSHHERNIFKP